MPIFCAFIYSCFFVLAEQESPPGSQRLDATSTNTPTGGEAGGGGGGASPVGDPRTWLVLYCGANAKVEKVINTLHACAALTQQIELHMEYHLSSIACLLCCRSPLTGPLCFVSFRPKSVLFLPARASLLSGRRYSLEPVDGWMDDVPRYLATFVFDAWKS